MSTIIDTTTLAKIIGASLAAGLGVTIVFSVAIVGITRFDEARRGGHGVLAGVFAVIAAVAVAACLAVVALGIVVMTQKT